MIATPTKILNNMITNSRKTTVMTCMRKHYLSYELGIRPRADAKPLRMGSAFHKGLDVKAKGGTVEEAITKAIELYDQGYALVYDGDMDGWLVDREILARMLSVYFWRWADYDNQCQLIASELRYNIPIINPATGRSSRNYTAGGMIDKIVTLPGGRIAIMEHKTSGKDLAPGSDYWKRLLIDSQISTYFNATQVLGYDVNTIIYDVIRKPGIKPVALTQAATKMLIETGQYHKKDKGEDTKSFIGEYTVLIDSKKDDFGEQYVSSVLVNGVKAEVIPGKKGFAIIETLEMYGDRLANEMSQNHEYYFARKEIARTDYELKEADYELWQTAKLLQDCRNNNRWPRNTSACLSYGQCPYFNLCTSGFTADSPLPENYQQLSNPHPELGDDSNDTNNQTTIKTNVTTPVGTAD